MECPAWTAAENAQFVFAFFSGIGICFALVILALGALGRALR